MKRTVYFITFLMCCQIADQSASVYGSRCVNRGDMKLTLGTGAFLDVNVGNTAVACNLGKIDFKDQEIIF